MLNTANIQSILAALMPNKGTPEVDKSIALLTEELSRLASKSSGNLNLFKFITAYLKRYHSDVREALNYAAIIDERLYICNGYTAFKFNDTAVPVPLIPENVSPLDFKRLFPTSEYACKVELPTVQALKSYKAVWKSWAKAEYGKNLKYHDCVYVTFIDTDNGKMPIAFNADYLIEALTGLSNPTTATNNGNAIRPLHIKGDNGEAIVLPIRCNDYDAALEEQNELLAMVNA